MRFVVDVTSIGKGDKESFCVEADSWQRALQQTRTLRNDTGPMSGFSIELLDDGCRAVDPMSRLRYEVRKAPDDMPLTKVATSGAPAAAAPAATAPAATASPPAAPSAPPRPAASPSAPPKAPKPAESAPPQRESSSLKRTLVMGSGVGTAAQQTPSAPPAPAHAPPPPAPAPATAAAAAPVAPVASQIVFKREQDATSAMPLTYREYVYAVASGTSESDAEKLLLWQLDQVKAALAHAEPGKLVNLAAFDVVYSGKPPGLPLATLSWKDWKGTPMLAHPRRAPVQVHAHAQAPQPVSAPPPPPPPAVPSKPAPPVAPAFPPPSVAAHPPTPVHAPPPAAPAPAPAPVPAPVPAAAPPPAPAPPPPPPPALAQAPAPPPPAPAPPVVSAPPPAPATTLPVDNVDPFAAHPPPANADLRSTIHDRRTSAPAMRPSAPSQPRSRVHGDELIADLFEAMHDIHFVHDSVDGGAFCLTLAHQKIPSRAGIVHVYDINKREFLITSVRGAGTEGLLNRRYPESDPLLAAAMRKRLAMVYADAAESEAPGLERFQAIGGVKSLIVAPVMQAGRFLGAIELLDPLDGQPFADDEGPAIQYIAEQFAEFVATRGVVTDPERISMPAPPPQQPRR